MKVLKIIGVAVIALLIILAVAVFLQPSKGHLEKSIVINASASAIYSEINSFKNFTSWSPWSKMDPEAKYTFEGAEAGLTAKMSWDGEKMGKGSQWIEESVENQLVKNGLAFEGMDGTAYAEFILIPEGEGTKVTWTYDGDNRGIGGKAMWLFMKGMLDGQYDQGLKDLKTFIESKPIQ